MATLTRLPEAAVIDGLRGVLDFYVVRGRAIVRSWPKKGRPGPDTGSIRFQRVFARMGRLKPLMSATLKVASDRYSQGGDFTWGDVATSAYYGHLRPFDGQPPKS